MPMATNMPPAGEAAAAAAAAAPPASASWYCTRPTPTESSTSASHCLAERDWPRYATKKSAVKSVLDCDQSWYEVAERRESAVKKRTFWRQ